MKISNLPRPDVGVPRLESLSSRGWPVFAPVQCLVLECHNVPGTASCSVGLVGLETGWEIMAQLCFGNAASLPGCNRSKHGSEEKPAPYCSPSFPVISCFCCSVALGYRCKLKRRCFAPAAFYKPFGEEAAGALTLSQFQALQESDKETASLRELGLSDSEILLWKNRASTGKVGMLSDIPLALWAVEVQVLCKPSDKEWMLHVSLAFRPE